MVSVAIILFFAYTFSEKISNDVKILNTIIYPNPTNDIINIKLINEDKYYTWKLFSVEGKLIKEGNETVLSIKNLPKGMYVLVVENLLNTSQHRIIKK